MNNRTAHI
jgi:hypothetical protein